MSKILSFGEILWDLLPNGKVIGGAPFNVAYRLHELGDDVLFCSGIGKDELGKEIIQQLDVAAIPNYLTISESKLTGVVHVKILSNGSAQYVIEDPAAWDMINAPAWNGELIFGSLALRHKYNQEQILKLVKNSSKIYFDVNLRAPYYAFDQIKNWIKYADLIKFNEEEFEWFSQNAGWGTNTNDALISFFEMYPSKTVCITKGEEGAILALDIDQIFYATAPKVNVIDTIGAGDAFFAALIYGIRQKQDPQIILNEACKIGALVAAQNGATTPLDV